MAERPITHVMPVDDGYDHDLEDCLCTPDVRQCDGTALIGTEGRQGALTFVHHAMSSSGKWQILEEIDEDEEPAAEVSS
jgi:hypothetical protein